jgi:hypothetical protein
MRATGLPNNPNKERTESNLARINQNKRAQVLVETSGQGLNVYCINITCCSYAYNKTPSKENENVMIATRIPKNPHLRGPSRSSCTESRAGAEHANMQFTPRVTRVSWRPERDDLPFARRGSAGIQEAATEQVVLQQFPHL